MEAILLPAHEEDAAKRDSLAIIERNGQHHYVIGWSHQGSRDGILNLIGQQFDPKPKSNRSIYIVIGSSAAVIGIVACVIVHGKKKKGEGADKAASE